MVSCLRCGAYDDRYCGCWQDRAPGFAVSDSTGPSVSFLDFSFSKSHPEFSPSAPCHPNTSQSRYERPRQWSSWIGYSGGTGEEFPRLSFRKIAQRGRRVGIDG